MKSEPEWNDPVAETKAAAAVRPARRRRPWVRALLVALLVLVLLAAEWAIRAGEPKVAPMSGVDAVVLPWSDPTPADFVATVDHDWWPLKPGNRWVYSSAFDGSASRGATLEVMPEPVMVKGIAATAVRWTKSGQPPSTLFVGQDRDGHLWLLGVEAGRLTRSWTIEDGSPAGLLLPAHPRRGDGHGVVHDVSGAVLVRGKVQEMSGPEGEERPVEVPAGEFDDVLRVQWGTTPVRPDEFQVLVTTVMARGTGPVVVSPSTGQPLRLVESSLD